MTISQESSDERALTPPGNQQLRQTLTPGQQPDLGRLPAGAGRNALTADISLLGEMFGELLDAATIGFRLEVVGKAMCPRLHVDRVGIRLLCTYRGPVTGWVEDASVDRRFLGAASGGQADETSGLLLAGHRIEAIPPFAVALLKGSLWQGNAGRGSFLARLADITGITEQGESLLVTLLGVALSLALVSTAWLGGPWLAAQFALSTLPLAVSPDELRLLAGVFAAALLVSLWPAWRDYQLSLAVGLIPRL